MVELAVTASLREVKVSEREVGAKEGGREEESEEGKLIEGE